MNQKKEVITNPQQHEKMFQKCLPSNKFNLCEPSPKTSFQIRIEFDAQLIEFRIEEHHEKRVGTNTF